MKLSILCFSLLLFSACSTSHDSKNLLGNFASENHPDNERITPKRLPVYLFPHANALGDRVMGTWLRVEDPR